ncbi:MAG: hypothetical protein U0694_21725 [Anaerolineae bacterium]
MRRAKVELYGMNLLLTLFLLGSYLLAIAVAIGAAYNFRGQDTLPAVPVPC